jgi:hypothetical protein
VQTVEQTPYITYVDAIDEIDKSHLPFSIGDI